MITFDDFVKLQIKVGTVIAADRVAGADKLIRLELDLGGSTRQVVAGIAPYYAPEQVIGKQIPILVNLEPRKLRGVESHGMILAVDVEGEPILLVPDKDVPPGSMVR